MLAVKASDGSLGAMRERPIEEWVIEYPDSDGRPMADNTLQYEWIVLIRENLNELLPDLVAGNLLWYPVPGRPKIRIAPDVLVALGRPKGYRGSYRQWEEDGVPPRVVFEVLSPSNSATEMRRKLDFYKRYGVEEYYVIDPAEKTVASYLRDGPDLVPVEDVSYYRSPNLEIVFDVGEQLVLRAPDGSPFRSFEEVKRALEEAEARAEREQARAEREKANAERERANAEREKARADHLEAELADLRRQLKTKG